MSEVHQQALIKAPVGVVWELVTDVDRHPEWWPDIVEVECEGLEEGCNYRVVQQLPFGKAERKFLVEELDDCSRFRINCLNTGSFVDLSLTEARGDTFVDATAGMEPATVRFKVIDAVGGKRYFTRWLEQSLEALQRVARGQST